MDIKKLLEVYRIGVSDQGSVGHLLYKSKFGWIEISPATGKELKSANRDWDCAGWTEYIPRSR